MSCRIEILIGVGLRGKAGAEKVDTLSVYIQLFQRLSLWRCLTVEAERGLEEDLFK